MIIFKKNNYGNLSCKTLWKMPSNKSEKKDKEEAELSKNLIPKLIFYILYKKLRRYTIFDMKSFTNR